MKNNYVSGSMRDCITRGVFYHVRVPSWASGGQDVAADSPEQAALLVGCNHAMFGFARGVPMRTEVLRHLPTSGIGCSVLEVCGVFETLTADHYAI